MAILLILQGLVYLVSNIKVWSNNAVKIFNCWYFFGTFIFYLWYFFGQGETDERD